MVAEIVRIPDNTLNILGFKAFEECKRIGWRLAEEWSIITYKSHTFELTEGYRIQGDNAILVRVNIFPRM